VAWNVIFFYLLAAISILAAIGMVAATNPVHSAIFLVLTLFNTAGVFVMLGADFLAAVQVIVYAGAVLVLMLFFLMLVDPQKLPERGMGHPVQRTLGLLLGIILFLEVAAAIANRAIIADAANNPVGVPATPENVAILGGSTPAGGSTQAIGNLLFTQYLLPFEAISLVLMVGILGAIVLALPERLGERLGTISLGHPRGTDAALPEGPAAAAPITRADREATEALEATREIILVKDPELYTGGKRSERDATTTRR
jgi:NADH-quinone oxidoreductase subunit J